MAVPIAYSQIDDKELDDAALWAVIDSRSSKCLSTANSNFNSPKPPSAAVLHEPWPFRPPRKVPRICSSDSSPTPLPLPLVKNGPRTPTPSALYASPEAHLSPEIGKLRMQSLTPYVDSAEQKKEIAVNGFSGSFPSVSLFKDYQNTAMAILEKTDYTLISGKPFIKKSGWRKISCFFNISFEIRDKNIEFDEDRNVQRAEFVVRAYMQGGRFSDGWGSCERREKRFQKPNHDVPSTAETRAKNKACQDLLGIGEYRSVDMAGSVVC